MSDNIKKFLADGRKLCEAATEGPWRAGRRDMMSYTANDGIAFKNVYMGPLESTDEIRCKTELPMEDSDFIAHTRTAYPRALEMLEVAMQRLETIDRIIHDGKYGNDVLWVRANILGATKNALDRINKLASPNGSTGASDGGGE